MADTPPPAPPGKPAKGRAEKVAAIDQIADNFPPIPGPKPKTYLEWSGTIQMTILLGVICVICGAMLWLWWWNRPTLRDLPAVLAAGGVPATQPLAPKDAIDLADRLQTSHTA